MKKLAGIFAIAASFAALPHLVQAQLTPGGNLPIGSSTGQFVSTQPSTSNLQPCTNNTALAACAAILNGTATITARLPEQWDASFFPVTYTSANGATDRVDIQPAATIATIQAYTISGQFTVDAALQTCCMAATPSPQMRFAVNWTGGVAREDSITFNPISGALVTSANVIRFSVTPFTAVASGDGGTNSQIPIRVFAYSFTVPVVPVGTTAGTLRVYPCTATATCAGQVVGGAFQIEAASTEGLNATAFIATPPNGSRGRLNGLAPRQSVDRTIPTQVVTGAYTYQQGIDNGTNLDVTVAGQTITLPALNATLPAPLQTDGEWVKITNDNAGNTTISSPVSKIFGPGVAVGGAASITLPIVGTGAIDPNESVTLTYNGRNTANGQWFIQESNISTSSIITANEPANTVFAGPTSGAAAPPTFRTLVGAEADGNLLGSKAAAASAAISFTAVGGTGDVTFDWTACDEYKFHFIQVVPQTNGTTLESQISEDAGATYKNGAASYVIDFITWDNTAGPTLNAIAQTQAQYNGANTVSNGADYGINGWVTVFKPSATIKKIAKFDFSYMGTANPGSVSTTEGGWLYNADAGAWNGIKFFMSAGNIVGGTIYAYCTRKS